MKHTKFLPTQYPVPGKPSNLIQAFKLFTSAWLLVALGLPGHGPDNAFGSEREYKLKAGLIYNITKLTQWPDQAELLQGKKPFNFCVAGNDPFGQNLEEMADHFQTRNIHMEILRNVQPSRTGQCHILFLSKSAVSNTKQFLSSVARDPVLVIGDSEGLASRGVVINFKIVANTIRFEINSCAIAQHRLWISAELINLSDLVPCKERHNP